MPRNCTLRGEDARVHSPALCVLRQGSAELSSLALVCCPCWSHLRHRQRMSRTQKARGGGAEEMSSGGPWGWKEDIKDSACDTRLRREIWKPGLEGGNSRKGEPGREGTLRGAGCFGCVLQHGGAENRLSVQPLWPGVFKVCAEPFLIGC